MKIYNKFVRTLYWEYRRTVIYHIDRMVEVQLHVEKSETS